MGVGCNLPMWHAMEVRDKSLIQRFLEKDRFYAAYALGDLEPELFEQSRWFIAKLDGRPQTLGLYFTGLEPHAFFVMGSAEGLEAILASCWRPQRPYFLVSSDHLATVRAYYAPQRTHEMIRMAIRPQDYRPVAGPARRLGPEHLSSLHELYAWGDVYGFSGYQLASGVFYGVMEGDDLAAAAGTHIVAPHYGIAALGNVFTHPDHRGKGYATVCTSAVTGALLTMGLDVVLNVGINNTAAINIYSRLGYVEHCRFLEVLAQRRGASNVHMHDLGGV